jgi:hypothetical protein
VSSTARDKDKEATKDKEGIAFGGKRRGSGQVRPMICVKSTYHCNVQGAAISLAGGPAQGNAAAATPSDTVLYVTVGPVTGDALESSKAGAAPTAQPERVTFDAFRAGDGGCPVTGLASSVDVALLAGDRLLVVRRPAHAGIFDGYPSVFYMLAITCVLQRLVEPPPQNTWSQLSRWTFQSM